MTLIVDKQLLPPVCRLFLCIGVLGSFTTFSSFGYEAYTLLYEGNLYGGLVYTAASFVLGVCGVAVGVALAKNLF